MITIDDIKYTTFRKSTIGGYRAEDVDAFVDDVQESFQVLLDQNQELENKLARLSGKLDDYKEDEDAFKNAFLKAEKISKASIREAKVKANAIIEEAKAEAEKIIKDSKTKIEVADTQFESLKSEVSDFKKKIINLYKEHLQVLDALPASNTKKDEEAPSNSKENPNNKNNTVKKDTEEEKDKNNDKELENIDLDLKVEEIKPKPHKKSNYSRANKAPKLKFGENYDISEEDGSEEEESPLDLFSKF